MKKAKSKPEVEKVVDAEVIQEQPAPRIKQYLLMIDELGMAILGKLMPTIRYVEVEGMPMDKNDNFVVLVNPIDKKTDQVISDING